MRKYYLGVYSLPHHKILHCKIFTSEIPPTKETHGDKYLFCYGAYSRKTQAIKIAMYQNYYIDN